VKTVKGKGLPLAPTQLNLGKMSSTIRRVATATTRSLFAAQTYQLKQQKRRYTQHKFSASSQQLLKQHTQFFIEAK
jgi:hypothetical protein